MPGQPLRLGPFIGGLNTGSDPTAIADAELAELSNLELDIDGSLISRPPIHQVASHGTWTERIIMIGEGIFEDDHYLIGSNINGVFYFINGTWTLITDTFKASVAIQYDDKVWLIPAIGHNNLGGTWTPVGGFTLESSIPTGNAAVIHKERLFLVRGEEATLNGSRLRFTQVADFTDWPSSNFFDVMPGDGSNLIDITVYQDNLLLFKQHTTFVLSYDIRPADAVIRHISLTIGAESKFHMVNYENQVYILHEGWVYEVINYDFHRLNTKVPFVRDDTSPSPFDIPMFLTLLGDRLICRFFNKIYCYGLRTRTWSEWRSNSNILHFFGPIMTIHPHGIDHTYFAGSCLLSNTAVMEFSEKHSTSITEHELGDPNIQVPIECVAKTKNFDMAVSHQFKRLWWWGADVTTDNDITGTATAITFSFNVTWADLSSHSWDSLNTWAQPLSEPSAIVTVAPTGTGTTRRFARFLKSLRYRQINFKINLTTDGSTNDGPARIFTVTIITETKQRVPKGVN